MYCFKCGGTFVNGFCTNCHASELVQQKIMENEETVPQDVCSNCNYPFNAKGICPRCGARRGYAERDIIFDEPHQWSQPPVQTYEPVYNEKKSSFGTAIAVCAVIALLLVGVIVMVLANGDGLFKPSQPEPQEGTSGHHGGSGYVTEEDTPAPTTTTAAQRPSYSVGDTIVFGSYEQDGNNSNGAEPVEWLVIDVDGDKLFVVSRYALDAKPFHTDRNKEHTWSDCSLRKWLNNEFFYDAFNSDERNQIVVESIPNDDGVSTQDAVFVLSIDEAKNLLTADKRRAMPTRYSGIQGNFEEHEYYEECWWWLRSSGSKTGKKAAYVDSNGKVGTGGNWINLDLSVRPAMYIEID